MAAHVDELWDFEDPAGTEARIRAQADRTPDAEVRLVLLTQVARALGLQERYAEAQSVLDALLVDALRMLALVEEAPEEQVRATEEVLRVARSSPDPAARRWEASLLNNLGMARVELGDLSGALATFEEALRVRERGDPPPAADRPLDGGLDLSTARPS